MYHRPSCYFKMFRKVTSFFRPFQGIFMETYSRAFNVTLGLRYKFKGCKLRCTHTLLVPRLPMGLVGRPVNPSLRLTPRRLYAYRRKNKFTTDTRHHLFSLAATRYIHSYKFAAVSCLLNFSINCALPGYYFALNFFKKRGANVT